MPTTSPDDWLQPELRTEALIYTKHIPEAFPGGPRAAASGACRADNSRAFESDADRLRQNSLMKVLRRPTAPAALSPWYPSETHLRSSFEERTIRPEFAVAVPHLIASIMSDPKWPS
jgi:hypothetical protein